MDAGVVKRLVRDKGFGFIAPASGGGDVFFHHSAVFGQDFTRLIEGQSVEFELAAGASAPSQAPVRKAVAVRAGNRAEVSPLPGEPLAPMRRHPRSRGMKPKWRS